MYILTGGAGFIGSNVLAKLNADGITDIVVVDSFGSGVKWRNLLGKRFRSLVHKNDFLTLLPTLRDPIDGIIHLGASSATTVTDMDYLLENNVNYSKTLATFAVERSIRFIYASSAATYGDGALGYEDDISRLDELRPLNPYGFSKHLFDLWARDQQIFDRITGLKFFNVYGPNEYHKEGQRSVALLSHHQIMSEGRVKLFRSYRPDYRDGEQQRDFLYVRDCADLVSWLLRHPVGGLFNVGTGVARSWNDLALACFAACGVEPRIEYIDMPTQLQKQYQYYTCADMRRLRAAGYTAPMTTLEAGVADYLQGYLRHERTA
jgi:ADP-L-glycero-D-manno-heptose 6-epimerase